MKIIIVRSAKSPDETGKEIGGIQWQFNSNSIGSCNLMEKGALPPTRSGLAPFKFRNSVKSWSVCEPVSSFRAKGPLGFTHACPAEPTSGLPTPPL